LRSVRGPAGGYELARERRRLSLGEIVRVALRAEAAEEERRLTEPSLLEAVLAPVIAEAEAQALARLDELTLDDLHARALASGFGVKESAGGDFAI
jgi:DNA-binding IscR family transcriptional regulator